MVNSDNFLKFENFMRTGILLSTKTLRAQAFVDGKFLKFADINFLMWLILKNLVEIKFNE